MTTFRGKPDSGNATAEFVMVTALVVLLFLGVLQVAFAMFTRNVIQDAASQGARYGAMADRSPSDGEERARDLLTAVLPDHYQVEVTSSVTQWQGSSAVQVRIEAPIPLIGPFGIASTWEVTGHAIRL